MQLKNKVAVVTGAASGLGRATCQALVGAGASVGAFDYDEAGLTRLRGELGEAIVTEVVDVSSEQNVADAIASVRGQFGAIHAAINCAGVGDSAKTISRGEVFPLATWDKVIAINLTGTFNVIKFAALAMSENDPDTETGERGVIINTASGAASQGQIGQAAYSASKAGVIGLTLPVARDLGRWGIRVVTISPGLFDTAMIAGLPDKVSQSLIDNAILFPNRMGQPAEYGRLVREIIENSYFNATTIDLDGGARMAGR
tara:strand:+ start:111559 stop:112332 length:774 start_codon:yes stop_codon:yes gene_type:complete